MIGGRATAGTFCMALVFAGLPPAIAADAGLCETYDGRPAEVTSAAGMARVGGGTFTMGDDDQRPEERAAHAVTVSAFWIDRHEVTNAQFAALVEATGHQTVAERGLNAGVDVGFSRQHSPKSM